LQECVVHDDGAAQVAARAAELHTNPGG
jgi:hypothetical protein